MNFKQFLSCFFLLTSLLPTAASANAITKRATAPFTDFNNNILFYPASNAVHWKTLYARSLQLPDESLLMTWENYPKEPPLVNHPIYRSVDGGATWSNYSSLKDQVNGWGMRFQPFLYPLRYHFGGFAPGTILAAGVSAPFSLVGGVYIDLYASTDQAKTWTFLSHVAYGTGPETITDGNDALWEPYIQMYNNQLVVFYSDQTDPAHSQKLVHKTTNDLRTWSAPVHDVAYPAFRDRPGMSTVAHIVSQNKYIMTCEYCGAGGCRVHYKVSNSPLTFDSVAGVPLISNDSSRTAPVSGPYVIWTPHPNRNDGSGLIIVSGSSQEPLFINEDSALPGGWKKVNVGQWSAYSRSIRIVTIKGVKKLLFGNGGNMGDPNLNSVACGVIPIPT